MIYCVLGPTASGKSELASKLASFLNAIIINFDAFQVYKELNKGTAKPSKEELASAEYYLYDFKSVTENYDVSLYQKDARELIDKFKDKRNIILVGGTGLYLKATLYDYKFNEEEKMDPSYLEDVSNDELYQRLLVIDEEDALKIGKNNRKRLLRALYIYETHGKNKTELNKGGKDNLIYKDVKFIGINPDRASLYEKIALRVEKMFENGLKEEVDELFKNYDPNLRAFQAIGYKEFKNSTNVESIKNEIILNTKHYAKRQMTFFLHQFENVSWYKSYLDAYNDIVGDVRL